MFNFIVCLAHFCEVHGPTTIICTLVSSPESVEKHKLQASQTNNKLCALCQLLIPTEDAANLVTSDSNQVFISTNYPANARRYSSLTKLVMKSLVVETTSDITKPMYFGDSTNGYCITKIFKIKDVNSRGGERKYSLMVVSDSETKLLQNWDIISTYFTEIILLIQKLVEVQSSSKNNTSSIDNERYLRRSLIKPKSLVELTNDPQLFVKFHLWVVELLKDILR